MKVIRIISSEIGTNSYLLLTKKPAIIDTGTYPDVILNNLRENIKPKELKYIILTHHHYDHTTATLAVKRETSAEILIHEEDANYLDFKPDRTLKDNEILNLGDVKLKIIHTPGHTPGSICLYEPKSKTLFSGDTVFPFGGVGRTDLLGGNTKKIIDSIKRLTKLDVKILYPGHGEITDKNVNEQIKKSLNFIC
jgi:glyoxylase-like metal-dependent hydrolase (beta-lactamase superfamily II)